MLEGPARDVTLAAGTFIVRRPIQIPDGFRVRGHPDGTVLRASSRFSGSAILVCGSGVAVSKLTIDGNRQALAKPVPIAPDDRDFITYYKNNGVIADGVKQLSLEELQLRNIAGFAVIIARSSGVTLRGLRISESGSLNSGGRNNTSGGILLEEGTSDFQVLRCDIARVRGNGIWTHSRYTSPRNGPGTITGNHFEEIGRDAIQVGHATRVRVAANTGRRIGWPVPVVDVEGGGTPVAIDTAGDVDQSSYEDNRFEEINGKCIDLDGFHDGEIRGNVCVNQGRAEDYPFGHYGIVLNNTNPDMQSKNIRITGNTLNGTKFGGIFLIGEGHTVMGNRLLRLNLAECNERHAQFGCMFKAGEPDLLRGGIYLGSGAERPDAARRNVLTDNVISGYGMERSCVIAAPGISLDGQTIARNECRSTGK